jgi:hypothetical protein
LHSIARTTVNPLIIEVCALTFEYLGYRTLRKVSISIPQGSVTASFGSNGRTKPRCANTSAWLLGKRIIMG